jgi:hypothetical protein
MRDRARTSLGIAVDNPQIHRAFNSGQPNAD